jgi:hypothetical protein
MIDVHVPHKSEHTWTDFFIHIATICVGLLIAIGLEQAVEFVHHRHQAAELRENLHDESEQILSDTDRCLTSMDDRVVWLDTRIAQAQQAVWSHQPLTGAATFNPKYCAAPDIPIWRTAKESGLAFYLTRGEITGYSEMEYVVTHQFDHLKQLSTTIHDTAQFIATFPRLPNSQPDFSRASPEDLRHYLALLTAESDAAGTYVSALHTVRGATRAVLHGETRLNGIYQAEHADALSDPLSRHNHF